MNAAQIHLALNHAPLMLSITGGVILIVGWISKNESFKILSLYFLMGAAVMTVPVFFTGEGTEELTEHLPGVNEKTMKEHESWAKIALTIIVVTGVLALTALLLRKKSVVVRFFFAGLLICAVLSFGAMAQTAHLGGLIRHSEVQNGGVGSRENESEPGKDDDAINEATSGTVLDTLQQGKNKMQDDD